MEQKNQDKEQKPQQPFFARFLEDQQDAKVRTDVKAGIWPPYEVTMKWPSDGDDDGPAW